MDGATYVLSKRTKEPEERSTNRKPDGLWFDAFDEGGRSVQYQYAYDRLAEEGDHVTMCYRYTESHAMSLDSTHESNQAGLWRRVKRFFLR